MLSVAEMAAMAQKLARSVGKAAWLAGTTFLVLGVPLIFVLDQERQIYEYEAQMETLLVGGPSVDNPYYY